MWKNTVEPDRPQMTIWCMPIACWIPRATNTNSEYEMFIACPLHQSLQERHSVLHYTYIVPPVFTGKARLCSVVAGLQ